ncbi:MAG: prolyl oligopeptidase family serine peptidase [Pontibacterium sp.]
MSEIHVFSSAMDQADLKPGFWPSDFSAADAVKGLKEYSQLMVSDDHVLYWVEYQPEQGGRNALCCVAPDASAQALAPHCLTPEGFSVRSRVHEYGGLSWCLLDDALAFVNAEDQQLWLQALPEGKPYPLTHTPKSRYGAPCWDSRRQRLIVVQETHPSEGDINAVINQLVVVDLKSGALTVLHEGCDFYDGPVLCAKGEQIAWISWMHPEQPWTTTQLHYARLQPDGSLSDHQVIGDIDQSLTQPRFSAKGDLYVISDHQNWWQIYRCDQQTLSPLAGQEKADYAAAPWQLGQSNYVLLSDGWLAGAHQNGSGFLQGKSADGCSGGSDTRLLAESYNFFRSLTLHQHQLYCVAGSEKQLPGILKIDLLTGQERLITGGQTLLAAEGIAAPEALQFPVGNEQAHAFFYPPTHAAQHCRSGQAPLLIFLHGGPTSAAYPVLNPKIQYWTQRGFAVADLNYRGSTGYGRDYRMMLKHQWGITDVADAVAVVDFLVAQSRINPEQVFIRGGSAGGFTALAALATGDCFTAGASLYGVSNLSALGHSTHKFESRYLDWLIGDPEKDKAVYAQRSPVNQAGDINCPVIFFQGMLDKVVPPEQTDAMLDALVAKGIPVEVHRYNDEYHGFRHPVNQQQVLTLELAFYQRVMKS